MTELTKEEIAELENWFRTNSVANMDVERPRSTTVGLVGSGDVEGYLGGGIRLSEATRLIEEQRLAQRERHRQNVEKRRAKLKRGRLHHNSKKATERKAKARRWEEQPLKSLTYGFGVWDISQEEWDRTVGQLWLMYKPADLKVQRPWGQGTKEVPYTIYTIKVRHKKLGLVYDGRDQLIYDLSAPTPLDIEKAPEGARLFGAERLTLKALKKHYSSMLYSRVYSKYVV